MVKFDPYRVDWVFLIVTLAIIGLGLPFLKSSATAGDFRRQLVWIAVGISVMFFFMLVDYRFWIRNAYYCYGVTLLLLVVVLRAPAINNAHSYLRLGPVGMQPAELLKLTLIMALARHLGKRENQHTLLGLVMPGIITIVPMFFILIQPDLGTAITLPPVLLAALWVSGARFSHLASAVTMGVASWWPAWLYVLRPYQKRRLLAFFDPERYETTDAYQLLMSLTAIGSGGAAGLGIGNGVITDLNLLPEKHNDFIFGVIAEEGGFAAAGATILLFLLLFLIGMHIAYSAVDRSGRILAAAAAVFIGWQTVLNIYVVTGLFPTTGVTLPLISYGGSSMVVTCAMIGLVLNVSQARLTLDKMENPERI